MGDSVRAVTIRDCAIGGPELVVMAGPCAIESREQILAGGGGRGGVRRALPARRRLQGAHLADRVPGPRLGRLEAAARGRRRPRAPDRQRDPRRGADRADARRYVDFAQIGSRNMQNIPLLRALGRSRMPVHAQARLRLHDRRVDPRRRVRPAEGNQDVVLCERGIRTFETATRFTLDVAAVPIAKQRLGLPVIVDPSHAAGKRDWVESLTLAGVACGADGLLIETHPEPAMALSDGPQAVVLAEFPALMEKARRVAFAVGRSIPAGTPRPTGASSSWYGPGTAS